MPSILIADRDENERIGIGWLITSCAIPYDQVYSAATMAEVVACMETHTPDVICLELDMIGRGQWDTLKLLVEQYRPLVLVMTAEATFERAMQGIELNARDLWLKPQTPEQIRRVLTRYCQERKEGSGLRLTALGKAVGVDQATYQELFTPGQKTSRPYPLMLAQLEDPHRHPELLRFLEAYPFRERPTLLPLSDAIVGIFSLDEVDPLPNLHQVGKRLLRDWEAAFDDPLSLVMYHSDEKTEDLNKTYIDASQALHIRFFKGYRQVSVIKSRIAWTMIDPFLTPAEQRAWIDMLHDGNKEELKQWMYRQFFFKEEPYPEPGLLRIRLTSILAQVRRYMKAHGLDHGKVEEGYHRVFETILYSPILYRIVQELLLFIYSLVDSVHHQKEEARVDLIELAIRYIEGRYTDPDLRLEDVARHVDRSPAYFSTLLSQKQGISFRQLLNQLRMKEAQRLLLETSLSVQEVAARTGFVNANYFSKIFKEKTGTTPRLLRNQKKI
ncbi:response regulator transcription factor [Brevibacillus choshinensis]|uniref:Helix-turn-helix domain-containing protein n=1 Tax=Brevibacillus choshinensis TaxID=54911 RepID=A0ABX7FJ06_BRECH|nr:response regulator transcription factor [Brevibacillus choshinensis]QRG66213.1 helix-turn-helix domain-containing protein [Brevibacillus choshinensis]